jgi:uncharacterized protein
VPQDIPHLPQAALIDSYGNSGFRFGGMSHRGSILCLPSGIWASDVTAPSEIDEHALTRVFESPREGAGAIQHLLVGTGRDPAILLPALREQLRDNKVAVETMTTGAAVRTYNILMGEGRPVAALLIAVD